MEIVRKARRLLRNKDGISTVKPAAIVAIFLMFFILLCHFIKLYSMVIGISDYIQEAVVQTATVNSYNAYNGVREGNSSAHHYAGSDIWTEMVSTAEISTRLKETLQLTPSGNSLYKYDDDGNIKYSISNIQIHCSNVDVGRSGNDITLTFQTTATAEIPLHYMGVDLYVTKPITLKSYFMPRF